MKIVAYFMILSKFPRQMVNITLKKFHIAYCSYLSILIKIPRVPPYFSLENPTKIDCYSVKSMFDAFDKKVDIVL